MKNRKSKWILGGICIFLVTVTILAFIFRGTILSEAGNFMAPGGDYKADVAILEGNEFIHRGIVMSGMNLLSSGKVKRLIVVLYLIAPSHRPFALNEDYPSLVKKEMEALGLRERDFRIIVTHIHSPITLTAARGAVETISKEGIKSAILLSQGFHTRRSYLIYQHVCIPFQIKIFPSACFSSYQLDHWWSQENGLRDFAAEFLKLVYYLAGGYIPFKFSY
jgi:uncharacterized SAM-binding protein YcdF (DUF218 family)